MLWRRGQVVDTWLWDQEVPGLSPGCKELRELLVDKRCINALFNLS